MAMGGNFGTLLAHTDIITYSATMENTPTPRASHRPARCNEVRGGTETAPGACVARIEAPVMTGGGVGGTETVPGAFVLSIVSPAVTRGGLDMMFLSV